MSATRNMTNPFVYEVYDKFEEKKSLLYWPLGVEYWSGEERAPDIALNQLSYIKYPNYMISNTRFCMRLRGSSVKDSAQVFVLDFYLGTKDWFWLKNGSVVFNLNGKENLKLTTDDSSTSNTAEECFESGVLIITKDELKKIADANTVEIKVAGSGTYFVFEQEQIVEVVKMIKCFYNNSIDKESYADFVQPLVDEYKLKVIQSLVEDQDLKDQFLAGEITQDQAIKIQNERTTAKLKKQAEEKEARIQKRRELIEQGTPEINYDKYQDMQKAKTTQMVIAGAVGCILFIIFSWWLGLIAAGLAFLGFEIKNFTDEKLVDVFGEEISTKYDNNWTKLNEEYKDDMPKI